MQSLRNTAIVNEMKSRAELDKEPRLMQFLVERSCDVDVLRWPKKHAAKVASILPVVVWVDLSQEVRLDASELCTGKRYVVPKDLARPHRKKVGRITIHDCVVCEHMGRLIE